MRYSILICWVFFVFISEPLTAQISSAEIDALVERSLKAFNVAGIAVAVVKDGKVVHEKGYGVGNIETGRKVNEYTNFQIASNSKAFTTAALSILVDEGKIRWQDKVRDHIPEFRMYNEYVTENFMIEDLLCHRSGMGLGVGDLMIFPDGSDFTIKDILGAFQHFKPVSAFRTKFDYDNLLYLVAGELIARVSGMSWEQFIQRRILDPLGMKASAPSLKDLTDKLSLSLPHSTSTGKIRVIDPLDDMMNGAAGGLISNIHDLTIWVNCQLNKGKYGDGLSKQLFSEKRQKEMWRIHTVTEPSPNPRYNAHFSGYGLGWGLTDKKGNMQVSHTGGLPGMLTLVSMIPDQKLGVIVLTNTEAGGGSAFSAIGNTIVDSYLGLDKIDYVERFSKLMQSNAREADSVVQQVWKQVEAMKKTTVDVNSFLGLYEDKWFGKMEIFLKDKQLWIRSLRSPKLNGPMSFYKANSFAVKWEYQDMNADAFVMFTLDQEGKAQGMKLKGISPDIDFSFDFQDLDLQRVIK